MHKLSNQQAIQSFIELYEDITTLRRAHEDDEIAVQQDFSYHTDSLCKDRQITQEQYNILDVDYCFNDHGMPNFEQCSTYNCGYHPELFDFDGLDYCEECYREILGSGYGKGVN